MKGRAARPRAPRARGPPAIPPNLADEPEEDAVGAAAEALPAPPVAEIRDPDEPEITALDELLARYGDGIRARWEDEYLVKVVARRDLDPQRRVVLVPAGVLGVLAPFEPQLLGLPVASLSRRGARLTLEGGRAVAPHARRRIVWLRPKGETMFLYGRHVLARSVARTTPPVAAGDETIVVRSPDAAYLGIGIAQPALGRLARPGRSARSSNPDERDEVALTNRLDLGRYLREPQKVPE